MNWESYLVHETELQNLIAHNEPIPVNNTNLLSNSGVELYTLTGNRFNAIYDGNINAIRQLNASNPEFKNMPNRDLVLYNDHLLNDKVNTIIMDGFFGTGKTSTACSHLVHGMMKDLTGEKGISSAYLSKPHEGVGKSYGHLPGDLKEKTAEEFKSFTQYFDRFGQPGLADFLTKRDVDQQPRFNKAKMDELGEAKLHILVFEYLRGRDIDEGWIILDETQNTNIEEISSFISRVGDRVKLIMLGDSTPTQIDKRGNSSANNGLTFAKDTYIGKKYAGYVETQTVNHILRGQRTRDLLKALKKQS